MLGWRTVEEHDDKQNEQVALAVAGSRDALEAALSVSGPRIARRLTIDSRWHRLLSVEDVMQVTYMEAFLRIRSLKDATVAGFESWLTMIAKNNLIDAVRALQRAKRPDSGQRITSGQGGESSRTLLQQLEGERSGALTQLGEVEAVKALMEAIDQLPMSYQGVIRALDLEEQGVGDYAAKLNKSVGAIHMLRSRAHDRLKDLLLR